MAHVLNGGKMKAILKNIKKTCRCFSKGISRLAGKTAVIVAMAVAALTGMYTPVWATGGVSTLNNYLLDIFGAFGLTVVIFGGFQFGKAMTERDSASKITALEIVIGGVIMIGIRTFVGMFGG